MTLSALVLTDALLLLAGVFFGAGLMAGTAGKFPTVFMWLTPWKGWGALGVSGLLLAGLFAVTFNPFYLVASGVFLGGIPVALLAGDDPQKFTSEVLPARWGFMGLLAAMLTGGVWLFLV